MTNDQLTAVLAERTMHWRVGPDRFLLENRRWIPRWRFQPTASLADAMTLLAAAAPTEYSINGDSTGRFQVRVRVGDSVGEACDVSQALAIVLAVASALGVVVK